MNKLFALTSLAQLGILMMGTGCAPSSNAALGSPLMGKPFSLHVGEAAVVEEAKLSLTFSAVTQDSRCPRDATCVWAGEAVVELRALWEGEPTELTFKVPPGGSDAQVLRGLMISIVGLDPQTKSGKRIEPNTYIAEFMVTRNVP